MTQAMADELVAAAEMAALIRHCAGSFRSEKRFVLVRSDFQEGDWASAVLLSRIYGFTWLRLADFESRSIDVSARQGMIHSKLAT
jgi:hypothetical protein